MSDAQKIYIGDGVYASFDGWMIRIETQREDGSTHFIYLEPDVLESLINFGKKCFGQSAGEST